MKNYTNRELNAYLKKHKKLFRRKGKCQDCRGRCCGFMVQSFQPRHKDEELRNIEYYKAHGATIVKDKWKNKSYVVIRANCKNLDDHGFCKVFDSKKFPPQCAPFPAGPGDSVYRYLEQIGTPCGFRFVNAKTGKPWNFRNKNDNPSV